MKIYFHLCLEEFTNCYVVVNDEPAIMEALIIDPGKISTEITSQIEDGGYRLAGVLITHNHTNHVHGLHTLSKIYAPQIYAADYDVAGCKTMVIRGDGVLTVAGLRVEYFSVPGHTADSLVFKIGNVLFTGDTITSGIIGETSGEYFKTLLCTNIEKKIFSQTDETVLMPGHGPPSTVGAEKLFNLDIRAHHHKAVHGAAKNTAALSKAGETQAGTD